LAPHFIQVAFPLDFASQLSNLLLLAEPDQKFQTLLNGLFFGFIAGGCKGFGHQLVVNDDVCSYGALMCMKFEFYTQFSTSAKKHNIRLHSDLFPAAWRLQTSV